MAKRAKINSTSKKARIKESEQMVQIDKVGNVTRDGKLIGQIVLDDGVYIALNFVRGKRVRVADFDEAFAWLGGQV